jgi:hypothetical protein
MKVLSAVSSTTKTLRRVVFDVNLFSLAKFRTFLQSASDAGFVILTKKALYVNLLLD